MKKQPLRLTHWITVFLFLTAYAQAGKVSIEFLIENGMIQAVESGKGEPGGDSQLLKPVNHNGDPDPLTEKDQHALEIGRAVLKLDKLAGAGAALMTARTRDRIGANREISERNESRTDDLGLAGISTQS